MPGRLRGDTGGIIMGGNYPGIKGEPMGGEHSRRGGKLTRMDRPGKKRGEVTSQNNGAGLEQRPRAVGLCALELPKWQSHRGRKRSRIAQAHPLDPRDSDAEM